MFARFRVRPARSSLVRGVLVGAGVLTCVAPHIASPQETARTFAPAEWTVPTNAYYPGAVWERRPARAMGFDSARLAAAIGFAIENESRTPRDLELAHYQSFGREPFGDAIGLFAPRGDPTGRLPRGRMG
jgi:hypothetical protein